MQPEIVSRANYFQSAKQELEDTIRKAKAEEQQVIKEAEEACKPNL